jgi:PiT family inorganic phosphate transporter
MNERGEKPGDLSRLAAEIGIACGTTLPARPAARISGGSGETGGTMVTAGAGLRYRMISRVVIAWLVTLPVTIVIAGGLYYVLASPDL